MYTCYGTLLSATSHTSQEPWPWNSESSKENVQRLSQTHLQNYATWSRILECSVKSYQSGPSTKCNFNEFLLMRVLTRFWAFGVPWSPGFVLSLPPRLQETFFEDIPSDHEPWTMIQLMPCRNPCRLYSHLPFTYSVCPSSVVWSEIGPVPPFSPMRVLVV